MIIKFKLLKTSKTYHNKNIEVHFFYFEVGHER